MSPAKKQPTERVETIVTISSNITGGICRICAKGLGTDADAHVEEAVNHYLAHPGTNLLHVGQEASHGPDGKQLWYSTVAVIGIQDRVPARRAKVDFKLTK